MTGKRPAKRATRKPSESVIDAKKLAAIRDAMQAAQQSVIAASQGMAQIVQGNPGEPDLPPDPQ